MMTNQNDDNLAPDEIPFDDLLKHPDERKEGYVYFDLVPDHKVKVIISPDEGKKES